MVEMPSEPGDGSEPGMRQSPGMRRSPVCRIAILFWVDEPLVDLSSAVRNLSHRSSLLFPTSPEDRSGSTQMGL